MDIFFKERISEYLDKIVFFFFAALMFFIPVSISGIEICFCCILVGIVIKVIIEPPSHDSIKAFFSDRINIFLIIFYLCAGLSMISSGDLFLKSLRAWTSKLGEGVLLFIMARAFLDKEKVKKLVYVFLGVAFLLCIDGLYQKFMGVDFLRGFDLTHTKQFEAVRATFAHYNDFGTFLIVSLFVGYGVIRETTSKLVKVLVSILFILIMVNLLYTFSRGAWVAFFAVSAVFVLFFSGRKTKIVFFSLIMVCVVVCFLTPAIRDRVLVLVGKGDSGRLMMWKREIAIFKDYPLFGSGIGLFMDYFAVYGKWGYQYAHNCYLQVLVETGILGFVSFILFVGAVILRSWQEYRRKLTPLLLGVLLGFCAFLVHAFFDTQLYSVQLSTLFWVIAAFLSVFSASRTIFLGRKT